MPKFAGLLQFLTGCPHRRTSRPFRDRTTGEDYILFLDCAERFRSQIQFDPKPVARRIEPEAPTGLERMAELERAATPVRSALSA